MKRANILALLSLSASLLLAPSGIRAQVIQSISDMDFGSYDFSTSYSVQFQLGTNGNLNVVGTGVVFNGGESAGQIRITSPDTGIIEIKCTNIAELTDPTATSLAIQNIEIAVNTGVPFGSGNTCDGIGAGDNIATTIDMDANPDPDVYIGGQVIILSPITLPTDHVYNTSGTGTPITMSVVIQ